MTTLDNRPNTALLVVDMQNGVIATAHAQTAPGRKAGTIETRDVDFRGAK